jgi:hypothetical protein
MGYFCIGMKSNITYGEFDLDLFYDLILGSFNHAGRKSNINYGELISTQINYEKSIKK